MNAETILRSPAGKILQIFLNTDFRNGHEGLETMAKAEKIDVHALQAGHYVIFLNTARDRIKLYAAGNTIAYKKMRQGERLDLRALKHIPSAFNGSALNLRDKERLSEH